MELAKESSEPQCVRDVRDHTVGLHIPYNAAKRAQVSVRFASI